MADLPFNDACAHIADMLESASPDSINSLRNLARYEVDWLYESFEELKSKRTTFKKFLKQGLCGSYEWTIQEKRRVLFMVYRGLRTGRAYTDVHVNAAAADIGSQLLVRTSIRQSRRDSYAAYYLVTKKSAHDHTAVQNFNVKTVQECPVAPRSRPHL